MTSPQSALPSGTVTFLFTDIEGSTRLLAELDARYADVLAEHRRALRSAFTAHGGVEIGTEGDSFFVAFPSAAEAVAAAAEGQRNLRDGPVRVRMGLHTGEPLITDEGYLGMDVHRAARISSVAHGGQVIFSERTRAGLGDHLPITDLGLHRLKDLGQAEHIFQLGDEQFPPLRSLNATNLPAQPNRLIGRERECDEITTLIRSGARLVTLSGPGGTGKTRLALQAAAELVDDFKDGVFWVALAAVNDPPAVVSSIEQTLGARVPLAEHIDERRMLLLLDNLEQVLDVAPLLADLLSRCPNLHLLVTSRAPLRVSPESVYEVPVLPDDDAVILFNERAAVHKPESAVLEICRRLDGLPLAVELAAARTRLLAPDQLLARLEQTLPLLTGGPLDAPERQRTLRSTIEWSYDLLSEDERRLFVRLAIFAGSFSVEAAEEVAAANLETLQALIEHSLLRRWASGRVGMLETIHEFAGERLDESGERPELSRLHAECMLGLAERANLSVESLQSGRANDYELVARELDNIRSALGWTLDNGEFELGLGLAVALEQFWPTRLPFEGSRWLEALLAAGGEVAGPLRARALRAHSGCVYIVGDFERGRRLQEESLAEYRALGDNKGIAHMLHRIARDEFHRFQNLEGAEELNRHALELSTSLSVPTDQAQSLDLSAHIAWARGDKDAAFRFFEQSLDLLPGMTWPWWRSSTLASLAELAFDTERATEIPSWLGESLQLAHEIGDRQWMVFGLALAVRFLADHGDGEQAGRLWGAIEAEEAKGPIGQWEGERENYATAVNACRSDDVEKTIKEGRLLTIDDAVELALSSLAPSGMIAR